MGGAKLIMGGSPLGRTSRPTVVNASKLILMMVKSYVALSIMGLEVRTASVMVAIEIVEERHEVPTTELVFCISKGPWVRGVLKRDTPPLS